METRARTPTESAPESPRGTYTEKPPPPLLPAKYQNGFWAPELAPYRKQYIQTMATFTILLILVMWLIMPAYYGSYADGPEHVPNLSGYLVNRDGSSGALGQTMVDAFENNTAGIGVTHNAHLTWRIIDGSALTDEQVIQRVLDEKVWTAVIVNTDATQTLVNARANGDSSYNSSLAVTHHYNQGRNENAANLFIVPYVEALLQATISKFNAQFTGEYLMSIETNSTAVAAIARAPMTVSQPFWYTQNNLRPFTRDVSTAILLVGNIYITIFAFIVALAHDGARPYVQEYMRLRSYLALRLITPLLVYIPVSFSYAMLSLAFRETFGAKYGYAGGFFLFWLFVYMGMAALGLATEAVITLLTSKFISFFLVFLIIYNVSIGVMPIELEPGFYRYGYGFPIYNLSIAIRTIIFDTKNHLATNAGILLGWIVLSVITITLFTYLVRRKDVRKREGERDPEPIKSV